MNGNMADNLLPHGVILNEFLEATRLMYFSSIILGILCILTILMVVEVYKLQEIKNIKEGSIEIDPLED